MRITTSDATFCSYHNDSNVDKNKILHQSSCKHSYLEYFNLTEFFTVLFTVRQDKQKVEKVNDQLRLIVILVERQKIIAVSALNTYFLELHYQATTYHLEPVFNSRDVTDVYFCSTPSLSDKK